MNRLNKRLISLLLALVMICGMMPVTAFAAEDDGSPLDGLNVLCLGDSITAGQGLTTDTRWTNVLASKYGWNLTNKSQGGISLSSYYYTANGKSDVSIAKKADILKTMTTKPDVIIVWGGHNDTSYRYSPIGTWEDETTDSFKGALKYIAELAAEYAPDATLFVLTPLWTTEAPSTLKVPENTTDNNWMFVDAIYEGADIYGWIPINMDLCGINPFTKSGLLLDNIHPNEAGTEKIVAYLSAELASYGANSKKEAIIFNQSTVSMKPGESTTLKAMLSPRSGIGTMTFTWSSSDSSVATVDANGKIIAVAPGNAIITATTTNGISAGFGVSVVCEHTYETTVTAPTCTEQGYTTYTCECGDSYVADYVAVAGEHSYDDGVCIWCGRSKLGADWLKPEFAEGDYSMVVLPDTQMLVQYWPEAYYDQTQWIAENADALNIKAALHMGDMINTNNDTQWTVCKTGIDTIRDAGVSVMPMRGNHDDSAWFNRYFDYATYGPGQSGFGGSYHADKLDHAYWFVTAGGREYMILSLGWAPSWDVLDWAKKIVNRYSDKSVILACHAYMNKDGTLLDSGDQHAVSSVLKGYPDGDDVWNTFKDCGNVVLAMGGHIHDDDLITYVDKNGAGRDVTSLLVDRQDDDIEYRYGMVAVLTFHENSEKVDINWYSTRYDAFYKAENQFSITVPDVCKHTYTSEKTEGTCTEGISTRYTCTICGYSYVEAVSDPLEHNYENNICSRCGMIRVDLTSQFTDWTVGGPVVFKDGTAYGEDGYISGTNLNLKRSDYISVEGYETIEFTVCARVGNNPGGGYAFYTDKGLEYFISEGSSTRNGNGASSEGTVVHKIEVPENAKYIRLTYWADSTSYAAAVPFSFVGYTFHTHIHTYKSTVTAPTCTEQGYTTYTCDCGDSYVDAVSDPLNHHYENNICSICGLVRVDLTSQFTDWTVGGPVVFKDGTAYGEEGYISGTNLNLKRSDYISVEGYETIEFTVCARVGNNPGGGYAFYTDKGLEYFISEGSSTRNGNGASSEGTVVHKIEVPENAKYIRLTYWADSTSYATAVPFSFVGYRKQNGPVIIQQPESIEQEIGKKFAITVKAEGEGLTYQWYYKDSGMKEFKVSSNKTSSYAYTMQDYMHNRQVYCVITDANGNSVTSETATITRPPMELAILEQPKDTKVDLGEKFSISPKVQGEGLTYQWYVKESGATAFKVSSNKTSAYAYTMQKYMIGRQVYCVITDKYGNTVTTDVATISLPPVELKILEQPTDVYAAKGEKFSISPEVQGDGLTYQWYYKDGSMKEFKVSSNKTSAYAYSMQSYMNNRQVYCVITDKYGNQVVTEVATIHLEK